MTGTEIYILAVVGLGVVLVIVIGLLVKGTGNKNDIKKTNKGKSGKKGKKEIFYKPEAYVDHGGDDDTEWKDSDLYEIKEGEGKGNYRDLFEEKPRKDENKMESWDDY